MFALEFLVCLLFGYLFLSFKLFCFLFCLLLELFLFVSFSLGLGFRLFELLGLLLGPLLRNFDLIQSERLLLLSPELLLLASLGLRLGLLFDL